MKQRALFAIGNYRVFRAWNRDGKPYYTVVAENTRTHRHYNDVKRACVVARACHTGSPPKSFTQRLQNDVVYLVTGERG